MSRPPTVETEIIRIGNHYGVRIPKSQLDHAQISGPVQLIAENDQIIVRSLRQSRTGWAKQFAEMARLDEDQLLDKEFATDFDETEWTW